MPRFAAHNASQLGFSVTFYNIVNDIFASTRIRVFHELKSDYWIHLYGWKLGGKGKPHT